MNQAQLNKKVEKTPESKISMDPVYKIISLCALFESFGQRILSTGVFQKNFKNLETFFDLIFSLLTNKNNAIQYF